MKRVVSIWLTVVLLFLLVRPAYAEAETAAGTLVTSVTADTVWTKEGSPYKLSGPVAVQRGAVLKIEPGVQVIGSQGSWLAIDGRLEVAGTEAERIRFENVYVKGGSFSDTAIRIEHADMRTQGGYLLTTLRGEVQLRDNRFSGGLIHAVPMQAAVYVERSLFENNARLSIADAAAPVYVRDNTFWNSASTYEDVQITLNSSYTARQNIAFVRNNFFGSDHVHIRMQGNGAVVLDGQNNYWGTVNRERIAALVVDGTDYPNTAKLQTDVISYRPFDNGWPVGPLEAPVVQAVHEQDGEVTGYTDGGAAVSVSRNGLLVGQALAQTDGSFSIPISRQTGNTVLQVQAADSFGRTSGVAEAIVIDTTPPAVPSVAAITNAAAAVTGTAEPFAVIRISGDAVASGQADADGSFTIPIPLQTAGASLTVTAEDQSGNQSGPVRVEVTDAIAPNAPSFSGEQVTEATSSLSGTAEPGAFIEVKAGSFVIGTGYTDASGQYSVWIRPQKGGTLLMVTAKDQAGLVSVPLQLTVRDTHPPELLLGPVMTNGVTEIRGMSEKGAQIHVLKDGIELAAGAAGQDGMFVLSIPVQSGDVTLKILAQDAAGNSRSSTLFIADQTAPDAPQVHTVTDKTTDMSGQTEAFAAVIVVGAPPGTGSSVVLSRTSADANGAWRLVIPLQKAGTMLTVYADDASGNRSMATKLIVQDVTPPAQPQVNVLTNKTSTLTGKAEAGAAVTAAIAGKAYTTKADSSGGYSLPIPVQAAGTAIAISVKDAAGNMSSVRTITVSRAAPNVPSANIVTNKAAEVSGKTEKYALVTVKIGTAAYTAKADIYGTYKVNIPVQPAGTVLAVTAKDAAGYVSAVRSITVSRIAPNMPAVYAVRTYTASVSGKTEAYAGLTVKIGTRTYTGKADKYGGFKLSIPKQRAGTKIYVTAKDAKGQASAVQVITVY